MHCNAVRCISLTPTTKGCFWWHNIEQSKFFFMVELEVCWKEKSYLNVTFLINLCKYILLINLRDTWAVQALDPTSKPKQIPLRLCNPLLMTRHLCLLENCASNQYRRRRKSVYDVFPVLLKQGLAAV